MLGRTETVTLWRAGTFWAGRDFFGCTFAIALRVRPRSRVDDDIRRACSFFLVRAINVTLRFTGVCRASRLFFVGPIAATLDTWMTNHLSFYASRFFLVGPITIALYRYGRLCWRRRSRPWYLAMVFRTRQRIFFAVAAEQDNKCHTRK